MPIGLDLRYIRDASGKLVGFQVTNDGDAWAEAFWEGFLPRLHKKIATVSVEDERLILERKDQRKRYAFPVPKGEAEELKNILTAFIQELQREENPRVRFGYLSIQHGFRLVGEHMKDQKPEKESLEGKFV